MPWNQRRPGFGGLRRGVKWIGWPPLHPWSRESREVAVAPAPNSQRCGGVAAPAGIGCMGPMTGTRTSARFGERDGPATSKTHHSSWLQAAGRQPSVAEQQHLHLRLQQQTKMMMKTKVQTLWPSFLGSFRHHVLGRIHRPRQRACTHFHACTCDRPRAPCSDVLCVRLGPI
jgi:hypothetical protein